MDRRTDYVTDQQPDTEPVDSGVRPVAVHRIKQALVTSRLTFGSQSTGANPYDSGSERKSGQIWGNRLR